MPFPFCRWLHAPEPQLTTAQLQAAFDGLPVMAWLARPDGSVYWYNRRWFEYTGTTLAEMEGWGWRSCHDPNELPRIEAKWRDCIARVLPFDDIFPLRGKDGIYRWFLTRVSPMFSSKKLIGWSGANTDIDHEHRGVLHGNVLKEINERLIALQSEAEWPTKL